MSSINRVLAIFFILALADLALCQLPDDIQRELNQNLAEQARIQAVRAQHQKSIQNRAGGSPSSSASQPAKPAHDPNNYSYQHVSPPIQYSYYQPYGDAAAQPGSPSTSNSGSGNSQSAPNSAQNMNIDLNNFNFDIPQAQARSSAPVASNQQQYTPSFTGAGGLPVLKPIGGGQAELTPMGAAPMAPQARVQQGPPLTEADFKDITGGENYGAPGGSGGDFGMGDITSGSSPSSSRNSDNTDAQLREYGMQDQAAPTRAGSQSRMDIPDFGAFGPSSGSQQQQQRSSNPMDGFGNLEGLANGPAGNTQDPSAGFGGGSQNNGGDFDFASQPSSARGDQAASNGNAPGSLQSLLGANFPGLGGGNNGNLGNGLSDFAGGSNDPQSQLSGQPRQRVDDGALDIADMGDNSDQFSGADFGGNFEQPKPSQNDQDFNLAAAAQTNQPSVVPYPDGAPQLVGSMWVLGQPQSASQLRYSPILDHGTFQDYPAYKQASSHDYLTVSRVVDTTPGARPAGYGRYSLPSSRGVLPEYRVPGTSRYDFANPPY